MAKCLFKRVLNKESMNCKNKAIFGEYSKKMLYLLKIFKKKTNLKYAISMH
jgi:hypothetical protein